MVQNVKKNAGNVITGGYEASKAGVNKLLAWTGFKKPEPQEQNIDYYSMQNTY